MYAKRFDAKGRGMGLKNRDEDAHLDLSQVTRPQLNPSANTASDVMTKARPKHKRRRSKGQRDNETRRAKVLVKTTVRAGVERDSTKVGTLERGAEVLVLEQKSTSDGQPRVRTPTGWVSIVAISGQPILQLMRPVHQKLSDTKLYTGTSRFHFDSSGKGKGLAGRPRDNWDARDYDEQCAPFDLEGTLRRSWRGSTNTRHTTRSIAGMNSEGVGPRFHAPAGTILRTPSPHAAALSHNADVRTEETSNKAELTYRRSQTTLLHAHQTPRSDDSKAAAAPTTQTTRVGSQGDQSHAHGQEVFGVWQSKYEQNAVDPEKQPAPTPRTGLESTPASRVEGVDQQTREALLDVVTVEDSTMVPEPSHSQRDAAEEGQHDGNGGNGGSAGGGGGGGGGGGAGGGGGGGDDDDDDDDDDGGGGGGGGGDDDGGSTVIEITVPDETVPGDTICVELPDGTELEVSVPAGCQPGDVFDVEITALPEESEHSDDSLTGNDKETGDSAVLAQTSPGNYSLFVDLQSTDLQSTDKGLNDPFSELASMLGGL